MKAAYFSTHSGSAAARMRCISSSYPRRRRTSSASSRFMRRSILAHANRVRHLLTPRSATAQEHNDDCCPQARPPRAEGSRRPKIQGFLHPRPRPQGRPRGPRARRGLPQLRRAAPRPGALPARHRGGARRPAARSAPLGLAAGQLRGAAGRASRAARARHRRGVHHRAQRDPQRLFPRPRRQSRGALLRHGRGRLRRHAHDGAAAGRDRHRDGPGRGPRKGIRVMSETSQRFSVSRGEKAVYKTGLRSFMEYRDLGIEQATHGQFRAHVIRIKSGSAGAHERDDESSDEGFYATARKVVHIDEGAIAALGRLYAAVMPAGGRLLDLMSSWRSHLPRDHATGDVVGLGLNAEEMADNPQLAKHVVHDVNRDPRLPFADDEFDGAMCAVPLQYVIHPVQLFQEIRRVLRPGSPFVVSFSNRCFPTKAVAVWLGTTDAQHLTLVRAYFEAGGGWTDVRDEDRSPGGGDPLYAVWARAASG